MTRTNKYVYIVSNYALRYSSYIAYRTVADINTCSEQPFGLAFFKEGSLLFIMSLAADAQKRTSGLFTGIQNWLAHHIGDEKPKGTIASLDGVRAIACIIVVIYHSTSLIYWRWDIDHKTPFGSS